MNFVYKHKSLCWLYCKISQLRYPKFKGEVERRAKLDLFDYEQIAQPLPKCFYEPCNDNNNFGIGFSIRQYIGSNKDYIDALLEHGYFFGTYVQNKEKIIYTDKLLTFSDVRKEHIEAVIKNKLVYPIGPYIHYAPNYYDEMRLKEEKAKLGKTLLVFFFHSSTGVRVSFDLDALITKINSIRKYFQTVVISLYWSDINPEIVDRLKNEGYKIFSSGHRYDYYFLSRQKTMIQLADVTMSNGIGTHIAYCTYLGKPHWLIRQEIEEKALTEKGALNIKISQSIEKDPVAEQETNVFYTAFSEYSESLSDSQKTICERFFGFNRVRSVEEMNKILR